MSIPTLLDLMKTKQLPPYEALQKVLSYDPETGVFIWKVATNRKYPAGTVAGSVNKANGYRYIQVPNYGRFMAHRLAWMMHHKVDPINIELDHIDRNKDNNSIFNLRTVTRSQNLLNTGATGIWFDKLTNKWCASVKNGYQSVWLGRHDCPLMAHMAYLDKRQELFMAA